MLQCGKRGGGGDESVMASRFVIPVFRNIFFGQKNIPNRFHEDFFFSCVFQWNFTQEHGFGEAAGIHVIFPCHRNFLQEFL